jgi:hypothetical protein
LIVRVCFAAFGLSLSLLLFLSPSSSSSSLFSLVPRNRSVPLPAAACLVLLVFVVCVWQEASFRVPPGPFPRVRARGPIPSGKADCPRAFPPHRSIPRNTTTSVRVFDHRTSRFSAKFNFGTPLCSAAFLRLHNRKKGVVGCTKKASDIPSRSFSRLDVSVSSSLLIKFRPESSIIRQAEKFRSRVCCSN